jgi:hypothetical protein
MVLAGLTLAAHAGCDLVHYRAQGGGAPVAGRVLHAAAHTSTIVSMSCTSRAEP